MPSPADPQDEAVRHDPAHGAGHGPRAGATARSHAHAALRTAILAGSYAPGQRLVEEELAAIFDVTRASLRAALLDLTAEGLVERIPNRGARVRVVSIEEAVAITECRMVLESLCAVKAALVITDAEAAELRRLGDTMTEAASTEDLDKYSDLNHQVHRRIRDISGQHIAVSLLERLNAQLVRHQYRIAQRPGRPRHSLGEHLAIIDAVAGRRPAEAEAATRRHLEGVIEAIRADVPATGTSRAARTASHDSPQG